MSGHDRGGKVGRKGLGRGGHLVENDFGLGTGTGQEPGGDEVQQVKACLGGPHIEEAGIKACHLSC